MTDPAIATTKIEPIMTRMTRKTVDSLLRAWQGVQHSARSAMGKLHEDLPKGDLDRLRKRMEECVRGKGGEVSARRRTVELGEIYLGLSQTGRERFLNLLAHEFDVDRAAVAKLAQEYLNAERTRDRVKIEARLTNLLTSDRLKILRNFSALPNGVKFLVDLRVDLMRCAKEDIACFSMDNELKGLFASWFDVGMLDLVQVDWKSPASVLEKLIDYEAVHEITSWSDLKNRLDSDRRCFAFFHNKMPGEPLIFVEVALEDGMADSIQHLLDEHKPAGDPKKADTAVFYSISNAQRGLSGISFGNFLIKRVVDTLSREFPNLKHFCTLSPIPGFGAWFTAQVLPQADSMLTPLEKQHLCSVAGTSSAAEALHDILARDRWWEGNTDMAVAMRALLLRLGAHYLHAEKSEKGGALDPVANFHLTNGARMERLNWLADLSPKGMKESLGLMVNYYYDLEEIDDNHEAYLTRDDRAAGKPLRQLLEKQGRA